MKKIIALSMRFIIILGLAACGSTQEAETFDTSDSIAETEQEIALNEEEDTDTEDTETQGETEDFEGNAEAETADI